MENVVDSAIQKLKKYNQNNILELMNNIDDEKKITLANSIMKTDFDFILGIYDNCQKNDEYVSSSIIPLEAVNLDENSEATQKYYDIGKSVIENGEYAVVTMAGGQGTRLNHSGPKGTFKINTINGEKSIFQILSETLKRENSKFNTIIHWYIMTSEENNYATEQFFAENNYFEYPKEKITFFKQDRMPILSCDKDFLVDQEFNIKASADGNGGVFSSLRTSGILDKMEKDNIKWVFICGVDNILVNMADPCLIGLAIEKECKIATKSIPKASASEKLGVLCNYNGKIKVIEYTEISDEMANLTNERGELVYSETHAMLNLFSIDAVKMASTYKMPYHVALKKNSYLDVNGNLVLPNSPNSYKFESFIFDAFELFSNMAVLRGKREIDFAPIKNAEGKDSPATAVELYNNYWKNKIK